MEEELEAERQARAKAERQRSDLAREMESLGERLNEVLELFCCSSSWTKLNHLFATGQRSYFSPGGTQQEEGEWGLYHHLVGILLKINSTSKKVTKLRKDLEECRIQHDATLVSLKKKQADSIAEVMIISS